MTNQELTPEQRRILFSQNTRKYVQAQPSVSGGAGETLSFDLDKVRLTSKVELLIELDVNSDAVLVPSAFAPYNIFTNIRMNINNGFNPFVLTGEQLYMYNLISDKSFQFNRSSNERANVSMKDDVTGAQKIKFMAELPVMINERDPIGLIMTQNQATTVTVQASIASNGNVLSNSDVDTEIVGIKITPIVTSFSIPPNPNMIPPLSTVKLTHATSNQVQGGGLHDMKLTTGNVFRKLAFYLTDEDGVGVKDEDIPANIELVLNQSDFPYRAPASYISRENNKQFRNVLPDGLFVFDFTYQGISNYGGNRDYIDTERLTEFWIRLQAQYDGRLQAVYETLAIMRG